MKYVLLVVLGVLLAAPASAAPGQSSDRLPDLGVAPIRHVLTAFTADRKKQLRFTVSIANVGVAPLEVDAARLSRGASWRSFQRIRRDDGTSYRVPVPGVDMVFVGSSEHGHWHIRGIARYELRRLGSGEVVRIRVKRGFCLYDSSRYGRPIPGASKTQEYRRDNCGEKAATTLAMGISVGWKDDYFWRIPGQILDITSVPIGKYRLVVDVDPRGWFRESRERNNVTWVDLRIRERTVEVIGRSPRL